MKKITLILIPLLTVFFLTGFAFATDEKYEDERGQDISQSRIPAESELRGMKVVDKDGEKIGSIDDVNIDSQTGQVNYVTINRSDLETASETVPVPIEAFSFDPQQQQATLTVDRSKLDNVPEQANMDDQSFERELETHYGISPVWDKEKKQPLKEDQDIQDLEESREY